MTGDMMVTMRRGCTRQVALYRCGEFGQRHYELRLYDEDEELLDQIVIDDFQEARSDFELWAAKYVDLPPPESYADNPVFGLF